MGRWQRRPRAQRRRRQQGERRDAGQTTPATHLGKKYTVRGPLTRI
jgi:hypothetical protein